MRAYVPVSRGQEVVEAPVYPIPLLVVSPLSPFVSRLEGCAEPRVWAERAQ